MTFKHYFTLFLFYFNLKKVGINNILWAKMTNFSRLSGEGGGSFSVRKHTPTPLPLQHPIPNNTPPPTPYPQIKSHIRSHVTHMFIRIANIATFCVRIANLGVFNTTTSEYSDFLFESNTGPCTYSCPVGLTRYTMLVYMISG